ncbi:Thiaminase-2 [compost metagenome]
MYSSKEFCALTDWTIALLDRLAEGLPMRELARLEELFVVTSKFEYMFWDMAYRQEEWPV